MSVYCGPPTRVLSISLIKHRNTGMFMTISKEAGITVSGFIFFPDTEKEVMKERNKHKFSSVFLHPVN